MKEYKQCGSVVAAVIYSTQLSYRGARAAAFAPTGVDSLTWPVTGQQ
jgi:hypothetical protein